MIDNNDMSDTIIVKSDQLNYSDFLGKESIVIKITKVDKVEGPQSAVIHYENENGKPYKPSKGMRVAIILCWGKFKDNWVGKYLELYGEPTVRWKGEPQGGIQIKSASDIKEDITFLLTISNKKRVHFTVYKMNSNEIVYTIEEMESLLKATNNIKLLTTAFNDLVKRKEGKEHLERLKVVAGEVKKSLEEIK